MALSLDAVIDAFADGLHAIDRCGVAHKAFQLGVGPYGEADAIRRAVEHMRDVNPQLFGKARTNTSVTFVSKAAAESGLREKLGVQKELLAVENVRGGISKKSLIHNDATPDIRVDPETYAVTADGDSSVIAA